MRYLLAILFCFSAFAQRTPRVVDSTAALVALTPSASVPDVVVVNTNNNTRLQFRYYPAASDSTNATSPYVYATSTGTGRWKEVRLTGDLTGVTVDGASIDATSKLDITNGVAVALSGSLTNVTANGITLTANGISSAVNMTAGDLQVLSSFGVFDATVPTRVRVLRDGSGYILGSGRWYNKATTDSRTSDGITIILPIDVPSDASPGRWVLEGYEP